MSARRASGGNWTLELWHGEGIQRADGIDRSDNLERARQEMRDTGSALRALGRLMLNSRDLRPGQRPEPPRRMDVLPERDSIDNSAVCAWANSACVEAPALASLGLRQRVLRRADTGCCSSDRDTGWRLG